MRPWRRSHSSHYEARPAAVPRYTIALARPQDVDRLPAIELAALTLFDGHGLDDIPAVVTGEAELRKAQEREHVWVALADDVPVGFAQIKVIEASAVHLEELDVHPDHGRRGFGSMLVMAVRDMGCGEGSRSDHANHVPRHPLEHAVLRIARIHRGSIRGSHTCAGVARARGGSSRPRSSAARSHAPRPRGAALARRIVIRMLTDSTIRPVRDSDRASLVSISERSVRATHHFLTSADIEYLRPLAAEELRNGSIDLWVLVNTQRRTARLLGIANDRIEALFLDPAAHAGGGRRLWRVAGIARRSTGRRRERAKRGCARLLREPRVQRDQPFGPRRRGTPISVAASAPPITFGITTSATHMSANRSRAARRGSVSRHGTETFV